MTGAGGEAPYDLEGIDPELLHAARLQPVVDLAEPLRARAILARAAKLSRAMQAGGGQSEGLTIGDRGIPASAGAPDIAVRTYEAVDRAVPSPALLFFHGGAFVAGDLETEDLRCRQIAAGTWSLVVSVDYRLAPENPFPAGFDDCYDGLLWVARNARDLGVDPSRIAVGGSSAGGALAAAVALAARDRGGPDVAFQLLLYPVTDDRLGTASMRRFTATPGWNRPNSVHMWNHYLGPDRHARAVPPYAAPARADDLTGLPPAYVMTVEFDPLRDEGIAYACALGSAGVPTELHNLPAAFHGFDAAAPHARLGRGALAEQCAVLVSATAGPVSRTCS